MSYTNKPTPGPWVVGRDRLSVQGATQKVFDVSTGVEPTRADAALIAAAPDSVELVEALHGVLLNGVECIDDKEQLLKDVVAWLNKVGGAK